MKHIHFTDNDEIIETKKAANMDDAIEKLRRMLIDGFSVDAERTLRAGGEIVIGDCETAFIK